MSNPIAPISLSSKRALSHLLGEISSQWAGPYTRRLSHLLDSSSSKRGRPHTREADEYTGPVTMPIRTGVADKSSYVAER